MTARLAAVKDVDQAPVLRLTGPRNFARSTSVMTVNRGAAQDFALAMPGSRWLDSCETAAPGEVERSNSRHVPVRPAWGSCRPTRVAARA